MTRFGAGTYGSGTFGAPVPPPVEGAPLKWGEGRWNHNVWSTRKWPPGAVWKEDWRWWYQYADSAKVEWELAGKVVEARWTTDAYALGDGTYRGDCQPGVLNLRLYDPEQLLLSLGRLGTIWATYVPTGATWCWFIRSITGLLAVPGDPTLNEIVVTADAWPARLTASSYNSGRPVESVSTRFAAIVDRLATDTGLLLPAISGSIAADTHPVPAVTNMTGEGSTVMPGFLQQLRDAGSNGLMYLEAVAGPGPGYAGRLVIHYDLWETVQARGLWNDQVLAASIWQQGLDNLITEVKWHGTRADGVTTDDWEQYSSSFGVFGVQAKGPLRVWGDVSQGGAQHAAVVATGQTILDNYGDSTREYAQAMQQVSGDREHSAWDPTRFVWGPQWVIQWYRVDGQPQESYRVVKSEHILNARQWLVTHTLEFFTSPTPIP